MEVAAQGSATGTPKHVPDATRPQGPTAAGKMTTILSLNMGLVFAKQFGKYSRVKQRCKNLLLKMNPKRGALASSPPFPANISNSVKRWDSVGPDMRRGSTFTDIL